MEWKNILKRLNEEKEYTLKGMTKLLEDDMRDSLGELSVVDNHPADIGTELYQRSRDLAQHDKLKHRLGAIESALERCQKGGYGICEHCGGQIPPERLELIPYTTVCVDCSRREEQEEQHSLHRDPVESGILNRSFAGMINGGVGETDFEGGDTWQAVARYGTSDTLQDLGTNRDIEDPDSMYGDEYE